MTKSNSLLDYTVCMTYKCGSLFLKPLINRVLRCCGVLWNFLYTVSLTMAVILLCSKTSIKVVKCFNSACWKIQKLLFGHKSLSNLSRDMGINIPLPLWPSLSSRPRRMRGIQSFLPKCLGSMQCWAIRNSPYFEKEVHHSRFLPCIGDLYSSFTHEECHSPRGFYTISAGLSAVTWPLGHSCQGNPLLAEIINMVFGIWLTLTSCAKDCPIVKVLEA